MKIAIPADEKVLASDVCMSFGRAPYFYIYETLTKMGDFIENEAANSPGGAGADAALIRASGNGLPPFPVLSDYLSVPAPRFAVPPGFASGCSPAGG